jgi:hypothetical protein
MSVCGGDFPTQRPQYKEARGTILSTPSAIFLSASAIVSVVVGHAENFGTAAGSTEPGFCALQPGCEF